MATQEKTAIVTGASQGIGAGIAKLFLERGYNVVATSRHISKANPFGSDERLALVDGDIGQASTAKNIVETAVGSIVWLRRII